MFQFYLNDRLIGHSRLESGDAPMCVAFGSFLPAENFAMFQSGAIQISDDTRRWYGVSAKTPDGAILECQIISIVEYDISLNSPEFRLEVECLGVTKPPYDELFPLGAG